MTFVNVRSIPIIYLTKYLPFFLYAVYYGKKWLHNAVTILNIKSLILTLASGLSAIAIIRVEGLYHGKQSNVFFQLQRNKAVAKKVRASSDSSSHTEKLQIRRKRGYIQEQ